MKLLLNSFHLNGHMHARVSSIDLAVKTSRIALQTET